MKPFWRSMSSRVFLLLLVGVIVSVLMTWWLAQSERQRVLGQFREIHLVERAEHFILALESIPAAGRSHFLAMANRHGMRLEPWHQTSAASLVPESSFAKALSMRLGPAYALQSLDSSRLKCKRPEPHLTAWKPPPPVCERFLLRLHDQSVVSLTILPQRNLMPPPGVDSPWTLLLFVASIAVLAYIVARMTMRPLARLAQAASNLGHDINHPPLELTGTTEIVQASAAFNAMQAKIRQHITQRTQMLAAITHDLQTPLTRLRLRLEKVSDQELRDKLINDLIGMQDMVREGLELARSVDSNETMQQLDIDSLLDSICSDAVDAGQAVQLQGQVGFSILARPGSLRRCLINLIDNAVKYGHHAQVSISADNTWVVIRIRDGGQGIPEQYLQQVFEPFFRLESSRSRESGGTGLGLTIARNVALQHGGELTLANHVQGGLEVCLRLPRLA
jgi:signal transduction histidine kinase